MRDATEEGEGEPGGAAVRLESDPFARVPPSPKRGESAWIDASQAQLGFRSGRPYRQGSSRRRRSRVWAGGRGAARSMPAAWPRRPGFRFRGCRRRRCVVLRRCVPCPGSPLFASWRSGQLRQPRRPIRKHATPRGKPTTYRADSRSQTAGACSDSCRRHPLDRPCRHEAERAAGRGLQKPHCPWLLIDRSESPRQWLTHSPSIHARRTTHGLVIKETARHHIRAILRAFGANSRLEASASSVSTRSAF